MTFSLQKVLLTVFIFPLAAMYSQSAYASSFCATSAPDTPGGIVKNFCYKDRELKDLKAQNREERDPERRDTLKQHIEQARKELELLTEQVKLLEKGAHEKLKSAYEQYITKKYRVGEFEEKKRKVIEYFGISHESLERGDDIFGYNLLIDMTTHRCRLKHLRKLAVSESTAIQNLLKKDGWTKKRFDKFEYEFEKILSSMPPDLSRILKKELCISSICLCELSKVGYGETNIREALLESDVGFTTSKEVYGMMMPSALK